MEVIMTDCHIRKSPASVGQWIMLFAAFGVLSSPPAFAADTINGQVLGAGAPIVGST